MGPPIPHIASDLGPLGAYVTSGSGPPVMWTPPPPPQLLSAPILMADAAPNETYNCSKTRGDAARCAEGRCFDTLSLKLRL